MKEKKNSSLVLTELFMAKAGNDFSRCYHGTIRRAIDENGESIVNGKINLDNGYIYARASDQWELGKKLDEMVLMILEYDLHADIGSSSIIAGKKLFLN